MAAGIIGSLQALEAIKLIARTGESLIGRLMLFDGLSMKWRELRLKKNPHCVMCGDAPTITGLIDYDEFCGVTNTQSSQGMPAQQPHIAEISVAGLKARLDRGDRPTLINVREPFEWEISNLGAYGARMIPLKQLPERMHELDPANEIILYCRSGARSGNAAQYLAAAGFTNPVNVVGGMLAWAREIDPSCPTY